MKHPNALSEARTLRETSPELAEPSFTQSPVLQTFAAASPELLAERALLSRVDTKCLFASTELNGILEQVSADYAVLQAANERRAVYHTVYLDTPQYRSLEDHHRGRRPRFKARIRHYRDRELSYLEVKEKTPANETRKSRRRLRYGKESLDSEDLQFLDDALPFCASDLMHTVRTEFERITLLSRWSKERVTLDLNPVFSAPHARASFPEAVIAEIKQERFQPRSPFLMALRAHRVFPVSVSKYCTAAAILLPEVRMNGYRDTLRALGRISHE
ncbi:MAG: polyphosphate polymerase domain-containing protein [Myxococcota bacterium]